MTARTHTVTLGDERDRLDADLDALVAQLEDADPETQTTQRLMREARDLDQAGRAVAALIERYDADTEVTVRELDGQRWAEIEDRIAAHASKLAGSGGAPGYSRNLYAGAGLVEAPFLNGVGSDAIGDKADAVASLTPAPGAQKWLESLVDDVGSAEEGNWHSLRERFAASASSTDGSS